MREKRAEAPIRIGEITIIPLTELSIDHIYDKGDHSMYVSLVPIGIAVDSSSRKWAVNMQGEEAPIDTYIKEIPELEDILSKTESL